MCSALANVRFGSKADMCAAKRHVCFTPKADMSSATVDVCYGPKKSEHPSRGDEHLLFLIGCTTRRLYQSQIVYRVRKNGGGLRVQINPKRLMADLREKASFGKYKTGVNRPAFSKEDVAARSWLSKKMSESGLAASTDKYGTVIGRNPKVTRAVLLGSHSDTVPNGGWLDGSLGVIYGLEIARCLAEQGTSAVGADAISFQDEEGTFLALIGIARILWRRYRSGNCFGEGQRRRSAH